MGNISSVLSSEFSDKSQNDGTLVHREAQKPQELVLGVLDLIPETVFYAQPYEGHTAQRDGGFDRSGYSVSFFGSLPENDPACLGQIILNVQLTDDLTVYDECGVELGGSLVVNNYPAHSKISFYEGDEGVVLSYQKGESEAVYLPLDKDGMNPIDQVLQVIGGAAQEAANLGQVCGGSCVNLAANLKPVVKPNFA